MQKKTEIKCKKLLEYLNERNNNTVKLSYKMIGNILGEDLSKSYVKYKGYMKNSSIGKYLKDNGIEIETVELAFVFKKSEEK